MTTSVASPADPLGYDVYVDARDMARDGRSATGQELFEAALIHRLLCEQIDLIDSPNGVIDFGIDVRKWVGEATTDADVAGKGALVDEVWHRDPRTASTDITVTMAPPGTAFDDDGGDVDIIITAQVTTVTGVTISRIIGINSVDVAFLSQGT